MKKIISISLVVFSLFFSPFFSLSVHAKDAPAVSKKGKIPIIVSTDLYLPRLDSGDNFDLVMPYGLDEIDLKAIILDVDQPFLEGKPFVGAFNKGTEGATKPTIRDPGVVAIEQLNYIFDRPVPYGMSPFTRMRAPNDAMWDAPKYQTTGIDLLFKVLRESKEKVQIITFGSTRAIAVAWARDPQLMMKKVAMIHISAGASNPNHLEYNAELDGHAMTALLKSPLPIALYPCAASVKGKGSYGSFDYWSGKDSYNTYWLLENTDFTAELDPRIQNYLYSGMSMTPATAYLDSMNNPNPTAVRKQHNVWETGIWIAATGRKLIQRGDQDFRIVKANEVLPTDKVLPNELKPTKVTVLDQGKYSFELTDKRSNFSIYFRGDGDENERALRIALPALYKSFKAASVHPPLIPKVAPPSIPVSK
jgi:pyrimidine-specific ribonucleoside hydrolase